jgi:RND family efflux transporter MFP subunit
MTTGPHPITAREPKPRDDAKLRTGETQHRLHPPVRSIAVWGPLIVVTLLAALLILGIWRHVTATQAQEQYARATAETVVNVQTVHREQKPVDLVLPGNVQAFQSTTLYARSNGFLGKWFVDIGDFATKGETLAIIETPDLDQQLRQAQGSLNQAKANFEIARVTAVRWQELYNQKVVSAQDNDQQQSSYQAAAAAMAAAQANVNQLQQLVSFNQIIAPFAGRITYRYHDVGALITEGSGSTGTPIYDLAQTDPLLIYVYVPQSDAPLIHAGVTAKLLVREYPGRDFSARVTRTAGAIDSTSRTLLTELQIPNPDGTLLAGMYGEIEFTLHEAGNAPVIVPANAFIFRTEGPQVVVVRGGKIHWQTIEVGRDYGSELQALSGLEDGDQVVANPSDDLEEGMQVKTQAAPAENNSPGTGTRQSQAVGSPRAAGSPKGQ